MTRYTVERVEWDALLKSAGDASEESARLRAELTRAEVERDAALDAIDAAWDATGLPEVARTLPLAEVVRDYVEALARAAPSADVESAPHQVNDTWQHCGGGVAIVARVHPIEPVLLGLQVREASSTTIMAWRSLDELRSEGWRRVQCAGGNAPSAGAAAQVRAGLEAAAALLGTLAHCEDMAAVTAQKRGDGNSEERAATRGIALLQARDAVRGLDAAEIAGRGRPPSEAP